MGAAVDAATDIGSLPPDDSPGHDKLARSADQSVQPKRQQYRRSRQTPQQEARDPLRDLDQSRDQKQQQELPKPVLRFVSHGLEIWDGDRIPPKGKLSHQRRPAGFGLRPSDLGSSLGIYT